MRALFAIRAARAFLVLVPGCGLPSFASAISFDAVVLVNAGDVIDFAVGFGNGSFNNDTTGLAATITLGGIESDVALDFSPTNNPNGVWQYGWSDTLSSPFVLSTHPAVRDGIDTWRGDLAPDGNPGEYHNGTTSVIVLGDTSPMEPGQFALHPGPGGEYAIVRYVAPQAGEAFIASAFAGLDLFGTTTDVHVLLNGTSIFDGVVGNVPEPRTLLLLTGGTLALGCFVRRRCWRRKKGGTGALRESAGAGRYDLSEARRP